jgi:hypothetical protein
MSHDYDILRADADYELRKRDSEKFVWILEDKRTQCTWTFTDVQPNGMNETVYLRKLTAHERQTLENPTATTGNRVGILKKKSLPDWLLEELQSIYDEGGVTPQTDPREQE